eukprot:Mycagemm_TRINITY_DN10311_c3_g9::TRINITY_DN10311_c3_g9_i2::g.1231::m.1231 type:complete len:298 gc:universal TRINITY_DN10311_c3_g9_i2:1296-403(-)
MLPCGASRPTRSTSGSCLASLTSSARCKRPRRTPGLQTCSWRARTSSAAGFPHRSSPRPCSSASPTPALSCATASVSRVAPASNSPRRTSPQPSRTLSSKCSRRTTPTVCASGWPPRPQRTTCASRTTCCSAYARTRRASVRPSTGCWPSATTTRTRSTAPPSRRCVPPIWSRSLPSTMPSARCSLPTSATTLRRAQRSSRATQRPKCVVRSSRLPVIVSTSMRATMWHAARLRPQRSLSATACAVSLRPSCPSWPRRSGCTSTRCVPTASTCSASHRPPRCGAASTRPARRTSCTR